VEEGLRRTQKAWLRTHRCRMQIEVALRSLRYINHLDPGVNKEGWSDEEL
jgi:hypothetical protein